LIFKIYTIISISLKKMNISIDGVKIGDIVRGTVGTFSQKYIMMGGYEQYNRTVEGTIIKKGKTFFETIIITEDGDETYLVADPGTSGYYYVELIKKD